MKIPLLLCFGLLVICVPPSEGVLDLILTLLTNVLGLPVVKRWQTLFNFTDFNQNEEVEKVDFDLAVDKAAAFRPDVSKERIAEIHKTIVPEAWNAFVAAFPVAKSRGLNVLDVLLDLIGAMFNQKPVRTFCNAIFSGCDLDGNELIDFGEYQLLFLARGKSNASAEISFDESDADNSGTVTREELFVCANAFLMSLLNGKCAHFLSDV